MNALTDAISLYVLNAAWQLALVLLAAQASHWLLRHSSATRRHALWVAATLLSAALPLSTLWRHAAPAQALPAASPMAPARYQIILPDNWGWWLLALMLICAGQRALVSLRSLATLRRLRRESDSLDTPRLAAAKLLCESAFTLTPVEIRACPHIQTPVTFGARHPLILLPSGFVEHESDDVVLAVLAHEMAHIRRADYLCNLVYELLLLPVAWHPATRRLRRKLEETREMACDQMAATDVLDRHRYARSLLAVATTASRFSAALGVNDGDILHHRIAHLLSLPTARASALRLLPAALLLLLTAGISAFALLQPGQALALPDAAGLWQAGNLTLSLTREGNLFTGQLTPKPYRPNPQPLGRALKLQLGEAPMVPPPPPPPPPIRLMDTPVRNAAIQGSNLRFALRDDRGRPLECEFQLVGPNAAKLNVKVAGQPDRRYAIPLTRKP